MSNSLFLSIATLCALFAATLSVSAIPTPALQPDTSGATNDSIVVEARFYWTDAGNGQVGTSALDGTDTDTLLSGLSSARHIAINRTNNTMYIADRGANTIVLSLIHI